MEIEKLHQLFLESSFITTDTRKVEKNALFFALKGERFDANTFAKEAIEKGACYVVIDNKDFFINEKTILVDNTLTTLQELAKYHRTFLAIPIIGLTGSNGKTTSKELINAVLSQKFKVKATVGNLNNHIGVPLTLLTFDETTEIGIVELGANHQKEIEFLCEIAQPDFGYITNFGKAHLEGFGGFEGVITGKSEMYHFLKNNKKTVFVNLDDTIQVDKSQSITPYTFSAKDKKADVYITEIKANPFVTITYNDQSIQSQLVGIYNGTNISAAITMGHYFGVPDLLIQQAIENYNPTNNRSQLSTKGSNHLILDAYNANPSSMGVALQNFIKLPESNKVAFLGDMFELGVESLKEHTFLVESLKDEVHIQFYFIGLEFYKTKTELAHFNFFETFEDLKEALEHCKFENNYILIKGSRGMALERIIDLL